MKRLLIILAVAGLAACSSTSTTTSTTTSTPSSTKKYSTTETDIEVGQGQLFEVAVKGKASVGDNAQLQDGTNTTILKTKSETEKNLTPDAPPGGDEYEAVFEFEALTAGTTQIVVLNCFRTTCPKDIVDSKTLKEFTSDLEDADAFKLYEWNVTVS